MRKKTKQILIIFITLLVVALLCVLALNSNKVKLNKTNVIGNTAGNLNNGGLFCEKNGLVYFSNPYDGGALYSMNPDGTNIKRILAAKVKFISVDDNHIYYYQQSASGTGGLGYVRSTYGMYRVNLKGKQGECLTQDSVFDMQLIGNYIYYTTATPDSPQLRKVKIDESENMALTPIKTRYTAPISFIMLNATDDVARTAERPKAARRVWMSIPVQMPNAEAIPFRLPPTAERLKTYITSDPGVRFKRMDETTKAPYPTIPNIVHTSNKSHFTTKQYF